MVGRRIEHRREEHEAQIGDYEPPAVVGEGQETLQEQAARELSRAKPEVEQIGAQTNEEALQVELDKGA
jgi:hypothetical protein